MNKMKKKITKEKVKRKVENDCEDRLCPEHGKNKLKLRGRSFDGIVIKKFHGRIAIEFERMFKVPKYERYEKRKTKIYARLPDCMTDKVSLGDLVQVAETRPISKMIHFVLNKVLKTKETEK